MHLLLLFTLNNTVPNSIHDPFSHGRSFRRAPLAAGPLPLRGRLCSARPISGMWFEQLSFVKKSSVYGKYFQGMSMRRFFGCKNGAAALTLPLRSGKILVV